MKVRGRCLVCVVAVFASLLWSSSLQEDTVARDLSVGQLERLVELLTQKECEDLLSALSHPEEDILRRVEGLSAENNQLDVRPRAKREAASAEDSAAQCRAALTDWLLRYGERTYYDRLSRALQHVGRTDIAVEVGKNINQDMLWNLKRYVEGYHEFVSSLNVPWVPPRGGGPQHQDRSTRRRKVRDLTLHDLDLIVEQTPVPLYPKGPLDVALPVLLGLLLGFGGSLLGGCIIFSLVILSIRPFQGKAGDASLGEGEGVVSVSHLGHK